MVIGYSCPLRYLDGRTGRSLYGRHMEEGEARLQQAYCPGREGGSMVAFYTREEIHRGSHGLFLSSGNTPQFEVLNILEYLSTCPVSRLPLPLSTDDKMLLVETLRQMTMQGLILAPTYDKPAIQPIVDFGLVVQTAQILGKLSPGPLGRGILWTSICLIALMDKVRGNLTERLMRIIVRIAVASACFHVCMRVEGRNEDLADLCRGPARALASHGWAWLTFGLWEAALRHPEDGTKIGGLVQVQPDKYKLACDGIGKLERMLRIAPLDSQGWVEESEEPMSMDDVKGVSDLLVWAGLFNLVLIPKDPKVNGLPYDLASLTTVRWESELTCGLDVTGNHETLSREDQDAWLGVAHDFMPLPTGLRTKYITLVPIELLARIESLRKLPLEQVVMSRYCRRDI